MKNNLLGLALMFGISSCFTLVTVVIAQGEFQSDFATPIEENNQEYYTAYVENAFHTKPRDLMQSPEEAKKEHDEKMQGMFKSAMIDRDCENKKKYNKELKKVAPQEKFKCMPKDPSIKQENTFKAIAQAQQEVRVALWEEDKKYLAKLNEPSLWDRLTTTYAARQSSTPGGNGYQSRCEARGDQKTTASEENSPCRVAEAATNETAGYDAYLKARLNHGPALEQDLCENFAYFGVEDPKCDGGGSASINSLFPVVYAAKTMGGVSEIELHSFRQIRRDKYAEEMAGSAKANKEASRQFTERDLAQNDHLRTEVTIQGEKGENERLKQAGGNSSEEECQGTCKFPKKFHDASSGQGGTQQHMDA